MDEIAEQLGGSIAGVRQAIAEKEQAVSELARKLAPLRARLTELRADLKELQATAKRLERAASPVAERERIRAARLDEALTLVEAKMPIKDIAAKWGLSEGRTRDIVNKAQSRANYRSFNGTN